MVPICPLCNHSHVDGLKPTDDGTCVKLIFEGGGVHYCNCPGEAVGTDDES